MASAGTFRFKVLVAMGRLPLHARSVAVAQAILGPSCAGVEVARPRDNPDDDDREYFVTAWCWHPRFIPDEQITFIPEPRLPGACEAARSELPGLRYLVRLRVVAYQDRNTPPPSPADDGHRDDDDGGPDGDGGHHGAAPGNHTLEDYSSARRDSDDDDSDDSNNNWRHPRFDRRRRGTSPPPDGQSGGGTVQIGLVSCPLTAGGPGVGADQALTGP
jgi:hypothetical protein